MNICAKSDEHSLIIFYVFKLNFNYHVLVNKDDYICLHLLPIHSPVD